jgi:hypothetical protein
MRLGKRKSSDLKRVLDPGLKDLTGWGSDFELNRLLCFLLHDGRARRDHVAMAHVADLQPYKVAAAKLAVDPEVEQSELASAVCRGRRSCPSSAEVEHQECSALSHSPARRGSA